ncbi:MAG: Flp pilus assembly complex ATPase component TadA [Phycisphaerales bacterium]|nr:Flp pilus assembly complex ATPase component TadA [Phycisphaerales bacterium]
MPTLSLSSTDGRGYVFSLGREPITIGRNKDNLLAINDEAASRYHCVIEPDGAGGFVVRDLGSKNGTRHNNERLINKAAPVKPGDNLKVGTHTFTIEEEQSIGEARATARAMSMDIEAGGGPASNWAAEFKTMLELLPPKGEGDAAMQMIDAQNQPSGALGSDQPGPLAMRSMILLASKSRATDLHVEPKHNTYSIRMRVDGQMVSVLDIPHRVGQTAVSLIKTACLMRMEAADAVQDGHFAAKFKGKRVDYRVSITPSVHGQKMVIRVLDSANAPRSLSDLGLPTYMHERVKKVCQKEQGFVLVCGPTGSGKTTTLYNALREIDRETTNIVTIEDPVEYQLEGTTQIPIDSAKGNSFSQLLRSVLRQDPDVILVGEIRDEETARTAMQAAMTGHLVFSTVHSKDSISAVFRILDLKVEPFLIASSLDLVIAQRLVRTLCDNCKRPIKVTPGQSTRIGKYLGTGGEVYMPVGCGVCFKTGYRGRKAIFELLDVNDELRDVILKDPSIAAIKRVIEKGLFTTLVQSGWQLAGKGMSDLDEIERVCGTGA